MANLNWGTMSKYFRKEGNRNNFRDQKAGNKFESNLGNKGTQAKIYRKQGDHTIRHKSLRRGCGSVNTSVNFV